MQCIDNADITQLNTFGVQAKAKKLWQVKSEQEFSELASRYQQTERPLLLGGGSNLLFEGDFDGEIFHIQTQGVEYSTVSQDQVEVRAQAGENWHQLVQQTLASGLSGLENLALIPGTVGAAPIQNIGAYGLELKDRLVTVETIDLKHNERIVFAQQDCQFGYRDSLFKQNLGRYLITAVTFKLSTRFSPVLNYAPLTELAQAKNLTAMDVFNCVVATRREKLPDPSQIGNAGSFFKNPIIASSHAEELKLQFPNMPIYPVDEHSTKVAAGWLIDQLGLKGFRDGDIGIHKNQALVLVNYGKGSGRALNELANSIIKKVYQQFAIELEKEVRIISDRGQ
ncbi:MAG: UDP-N-acetylmuramate dehydrogenase [Gammaproteobacteria bacterium]|nr:UDP-N-acetylmuramate dehydrogenase [Gammaproteobacteria bacterium]